MRANILLIEDNPVQQRVLQKMLEADFMVHAYSTCHDSLDALAGRMDPPDLILCDMQLPDGSGLDLRQMIQQRNELKLCPFIFLTGSLDNQVRRRAMEMGIDDFLQKPVEREELIDVLNRTLTRSRQLRHGHDQKLQQQLNQPLRPHLPEQIGPYNCWLQHRETMSGGGDFAFLLETPKTHFILIGDVMGHGAPAKFFLHAYAGYLYGTVRALRDEAANLGAADLLTLLNEAVFADPYLRNWSLTCMVVALHEEGPVTLAGAGHPSPWLLTSQGIETLHVSGVLPGLLPEAHYEETSVDLPPGARLLLHTDGIQQPESFQEHLCKMPTPQMGEMFMADSKGDDATLVILERPSFLHRPAGIDNL